MQDLENKTILIASGPTFAPIDAVRGVANRSTGRLGSAIARELARRGARIHFLAGEGSMTPSLLDPDADRALIREKRFLTVDQLSQAIRHSLARRHFDAVLMAAAVLDYIPAGVVEGKKKSDADEWIVRLKRGEKIIEKIREWAPEVFLVGFKLEAGVSLEELIERSADLMKRSGAGLVVANRVEEIGGGRHVAFLIDQDREGGHQASAPLLTREDIANSLGDYLAQHL
ncbi:MAG: phosphopantothenoylcysteine decarboxylase [Candidatus Omnitrophica bacterium]|nr:phosphopantothenoylcysteine decarboxylase [Candidatus Omnitrophota bacterium]